MDAARTEWAESHVKQLSDNLIVAGVVVVRYKADGQEVERVGWTYLLQKTSGGWKIGSLGGTPRRHCVAARLSRPSHRKG